MTGKSEQKAGLKRANNDEDAGAGRFKPFGLWSNWRLFLLNCWPCFSDSRGFFARYKWYILAYTVAAVSLAYPTVYNNYYLKKSKDWGLMSPRSIEMDWTVIRTSFRVSF